MKIIEYNPKYRQDFIDYAIVGAASVVKLATAAYLFYKKYKENIGVKVTRE